jgi:hypothetical protein
LPTDAAVIATARPQLTWWHENGKAGRYTVLIGQDPTIRKGVRRFIVNGAMKFTLPVDMPEGMWFWAVLPQLNQWLNEYAHVCLREVQSFTIVKNRGTPADTSPPHLYRMRPALDSTTKTNSPDITLKWLDSIDPKSVTCLLDGKTVSAKINKDNLSIKTSNLSKPAFPI